MSLHLIRPILFVILPLIAGACIYLFIRKDEALFMQWIHLDSRYQPQCDYRILNHSLSDFLWLLALCNLMGFIWRESFKQFFFWASVACAVALLSELAQEARLIRGTYDNADMASYTLSYILSLFLYPQLHNHKTNNRNEKST